MPDKEGQLVVGAGQSITSEFFKTSLPAIAMSSVFAATDFVNTYILSLQYAEDGVAAGGLFSSLQLLLQGFIASFFFLVGSLEANMKDRSEEKSSSLLFYALLLSVVASIPMLVWYPLSEKYFLAIGQDTNASKIAGHLFSSYTWGCWADTSFFVLGLYAVAKGEWLATFLFQVTQKALALTAAYFFLNVENASDFSGASNIGHSYSGASVAAFILFLVYLKARKKFSYPGRLALKQYASYWPKEIAKSGWQISLHRGFDLAILAWLIQMTGQISEESISAVEIACRYAAIPIVVMIGVSQALSILIAKYESNPKVIQELMRLGIFTSLSVSAAFIALLNPFAEKLTGFFINPNSSSDFNASKLEAINAEIVDVAASVLWALTISTSTGGLASIYTGAFWGSFKTRDPMIANITQSLVCLGLAYALINLTDLGASGVFVSRGSCATGYFLYLLVVWEKGLPTWRCPAKCRLGGKFLKSSRSNVVTQVAFSELGGGDQNNPGAFKLLL